MEDHLAPIGATRAAIGEAADADPLNVGGRSWLVLKGERQG
jgi:hypothetical protein